MDADMMGRGAGRSLLLGIRERLVFVDTADLARCRARGYRMTGNRIAVVTDNPEDLVEVHPPPRHRPAYSK